MYISIIRWVVVVALYLMGSAHAKGVFAHYMVGTITQTHANQDIDNAIAVGLDGFVLNIGDPSQDYVANTLSYLFGHTAGTNFKLFISMDLAASGGACAAGSSCCNGPNDYEAILTNYMSHPAYALGPNGLAMISTFSSGGFQIDIWNAWKKHFASDMYFIPMLDDTAGYYDAASGWWSYWGELIDGLFSWDSAWPTVGNKDSSSIGSLSRDMPVIKASIANKKGYMIALSTLQFKDAYGVNLYRAGDLNLPVRMSNILSMTPQPEFVEIITWNDGPESHYIGNIWPEANNDPQATIYANQASWPHTGWQPLITSFIQAWKAGGTSSSMAPPANTQAVGALWYKTITQKTTCPNNVQPPNGSETATDSLNWAIVLASGYSGMKARVVSDGVVLQEAGLYPGFNYGSQSGLQVGVQRLELVDSSGNVAMSATGGKCVSDACPDGIYNLNDQVVGLAGGSGDGGSC